MSDPRPRSSWTFAAPLLAWLAMLVIPHPPGLSSHAWHYFGLFAGVIVALVLEPLPPAAVGLIGVTTAAVLGDVAAKPGDALKWALGGFSDGTVWLIFGSLTLCTGFDKTGLGRRIALTLVKVLGRSTLGLGYAVTLADLALAPFTSTNTGRSAGVIYPIVRSIPALYGSAPGPTARRIGAYLMWTAFAATSITSSMFLTALAPNLLAVGLIREETALSITWSQWSLGFLPVGALLIAVLPLLVYLIYPPVIRSSPDVPTWADAELRRMGRLSGREAGLGVLTVVAFGLWVFASQRIHATTAILVVIALMLIFRVLEWDEVIGNRAAWDTMVYFATLLSLAEGLNHLGIVSWAARGVSSHLHGISPVAAAVGFVVFFFLVHYAFASLTAHTVVVFPALLAAGAAYPGMPVKVFAMLLAYSIGLMGVITPYATGPAPVYFSSGFIRRREFWVLGLVFGLVFLTALLAVGLPYLQTYTP